MDTYRVKVLKISTDFTPRTIRIVLWNFCKVLVRHEVVGIKNLVRTLKRFFRFLLTLTERTRENVHVSFLRIGRQTLHGLSSCV